MDDLVPILDSLLKDKNPFIVKQSIEYYRKAINQTYIDDLKKIFPSFTPALAKIGNHHDNSIREMSLQVLGLLKGRLGAEIEKFIGDFNQQKLDKIIESAGEYQLTKYDKPRIKKKTKKVVENKAEASGDAVMSFDNASKPK